MSLWLWPDKTSSYGGNFASLEFWHCLNLALGEYVNKFAWGMWTEQADLNLINIC